MQTFSRRQFLGGALASAVAAGLPVGALGRRLPSSGVLVAAVAPRDEVPKFLQGHPSFTHIAPGPTPGTVILETLRASGFGRLVVYCDTPTLIGLLQSLPHPPSIHWVNPTVPEQSEADALFRLRHPDLPRPHLSVCGAELSDSVAGSILGVQANLPDDIAAAKQAMMQRLLCVAGDPAWGELQDVHTQGLNWRLMRLEFSGGRSAVFSRGKMIVEGVRTEVRFVPDAWLPPKESVDRYINSVNPVDDAGCLWKAWELTEAAFKAAAGNGQASAPDLSKGAFA